MKSKNGFTLIECIITFAIFGMVLSVVMSLYLTGYKLYRKAESQSEVEESVRIVMNRISQILRYTDDLQDNVSVSDNQLKIRNYKYYLSYTGFHEMINNTSNNLAQNISHFEAGIENNILTVHIEGGDDTHMPPFIMKQVFYLGGE